jgi:hypothetical protein
MSRLTKYAGIGALVVIITALTISSAAFAQGTPSATPTAPQVHSFGRGMMCGQAGLDAAAKALNMTSTDLSAQLWGGQTLSGLADKAGVKVTDVQTAVQAACLQAQKDAIQQAVKDGKITQANADWLTEGLDKGYWGGNGSFGFGFGFGMRGRGWGHGFGGFTAPKSNTPNSGGTTSPSRYAF